MSVITLLTDFGTRDEYVGLMKGVILSIQPSATIVDITHQIGRQDVLQAAYTVHGSYRYFPAGSVHLVVVDPGVGTSRSLLALDMQHHYFVAPDNGVLSLLLEAGSVTALVKITNPKYYRETVSHTFHGRDIIAPVGAYITQGVELRQLGDKMALADAVRIPDIRVRKTKDGKITGKIVSVDHFGNLITNIEIEMLLPGDSAEKTGRPLIQVGSHTIQGVDRTYANGQANKPLALIGSRGYLEIAVPGGSAAQLLKAGRGDRVQVRI
jgi:S-adenosylmethionine hydrolase